MPRSEIELRDARFNMERDWRNLEQGYRILTPMAGVLWDEAWRGSLRVLLVTRVVMRLRAGFGCAQGGGEDEAPATPPSRWASRERLVRAPVHPSRGGWRASALPR